MAEDITIGVSIFLALLFLAWVGRKFNIPDTDIWA